MGTVGRFFGGDDLESLLAEGSCQEIKLGRLAGAVDPFKDDKHERKRGVARPAGLEPATYALEVRCSIQLSYGRVTGRVLPRSLQPGKLLIDGRSGNSRGGRSFEQAGTPRSSSSPTEAELKVLVELLPKNKSSAALVTCNTSQT